METINEVLVVENNVVGNETIQTINARSVWQWLGSERQFGNWINQRVETYRFIEGEDFLTILLKTPEGGRPRKEYHISLSMAKELCI